MTRQIAPPKQCEACEGMRRGFPYTVYRKSHQKHWSIAGKSGKCLRKLRRLRKLRCRRRPKSYDAFINSVSRTTRSCNSQLFLTRYSNSPRYSGNLLMTIYAPPGTSRLCACLTNTSSPILYLCVMTPPPTHSTNQLFHRISSGQRDILSLRRTDRRLFSIADKRGKCLRIPSQASQGRVVSRESPR